MPQILKFSDGTTTVDFVTSTSGYAVTRWDTAVAKRRQSMLGGRGPYEDVVEVMEITINGTAALDKLQTLQNLFEQVTRWERGENVDAVLMHYQPESTSQEWKAVISGGDGNEPMIRLPENFVMSPVFDYIDPVRLRFRRRGVWLGESVTTTSSAAAHPTTLTMDMTTSVDIASPVRLRLQDAAQQDAGAYDCYVLMVSGATSTEAASRLALVNAETMTTTGWTSVTDTAADAKNNSILRYTPTTTSFSKSDLESITSTADAGMKKWGMFVNYRNNSTAASYQVRGVMNAMERTPILQIASGTSGPTWAYLGAVALDRIPFGVQLEVKASSTGGTIDFDTVALLAMDGSASPHVVAPIRKSEAVNTGDFDLIIDHQLLSKNGPFVGIDNTEMQGQGYYGDATLTMRGRYIAAAWLSVDPDNQWVRTTAGNAVSSAFVATRLEGRLTPE